jgi:hypothetical protein
MKEGITKMEQLIELQARIRTTQSTQGFTTIEGLTNDGRLTHAEAVCFLNNDAKARDAVASDLSSPVQDKDGLYFHIYNGYFGMNSKDGKLEGTLYTKSGGKEDNSNPYFHWKSADTTVYGYGVELEWGTFHPQMPNTSPCDPQTISEFETKGWATNGGVDADKRQGLKLCTLAQGITLNTTNIQSATTDIVTGKQWIPNGVPAEYYTFFISGFFKPDVTGDWHFKIGGDDGVYLEMDTDNGFKRVVAVPGLHGYVVKDTESTNAPVKLTKGKMYWFKYVGGENWGGDLFSLQFKCKDSPGLAHNWTGIGNGYYYLTNDSLTKRVLNPRDEYPLDKIENAKLFWENSGKPDSYKCTPNSKSSLTLTDTINYGKNVYSDNYKQTSDNIVPRSEFYNRMWKETGKPDNYTFPLPKVEPFVEGLKIEEPKIDKYLTEMTSLGITTQNMPSALQTFKQTYGVDISRPSQVTTFFGPLKDFGILNYEDLETFRAVFSASNYGFLSVNQYNQFIEYMSQLGIKYNTDKFKQFMSKIKSYGITTFDNLKNFGTQTATIGFDSTSNPLSVISVLETFEVESYNRVASLVKSMKTYAGTNDVSIIPSCIKSLVSFGVTFSNFNDFLTDSTNVSSGILINYINTFSEFGIKYIGSNGTTSDFKRFIIQFINVMPTMQVSETAEKHIKGINFYKSVGFNSHRSLEITTIINASIVNGGNRIFLHEMVKDTNVMTFLDIQDNTMSQMKSRIDRVISDIYGVFGNTLCDFNGFITLMYVNKKLKHDSFKAFIKQNQQLFKAELSDFIKCSNNGQPTVNQGAMRAEESFTTIREGLDSGSRLMNSSVPFGISNYASAVTDPDADNNYISISNFNQILSSFEVDSVPKYKIFLDKMRQFGVTPESVLKYTNKLKMFRIKYSNFVSFTVYIDTIGVKYATFDPFIDAIMSIGVYAEDFVPFLCHLYSFGIMYDASPNSMFFRFIEKMRDYGITYMRADDGGNRFTNAIKNFIFILTYGIQSLDCSVPVIDIRIESDAQENQLKTNAKDMVKKGETIKSRFDYAKYFFEFKATSQDPITVPLTKIIDICKSIDPNIYDIIHLNPYAKMNKIGYISDVVVTSGGGIDLNEPSENKVIPYPVSFKTSYRGFMKFFVETDAKNEVKTGAMRQMEYAEQSVENINVKQSILDVPLVSTFMEDLDGKNEYKNLKLNNKISIPIVHGITEKMEKYNKMNNGKHEKKSNYANYNLSINTMRIFPNFSVAYMIYFIKNSPNMAIVINDPNSSKNPDNTRCTPYNKVKYDIQDCGESFTGYNESTQLILNNSANARPVQLNGKQRTIQSSHYDTWNPKPTFSNANW